MKEIHINGRRKKILDIACHYGSAEQSRQCIEECAELIQALNKWHRCQNAGNAARSNAAVVHIAEEIADVEIMLEQLTFLFGCQEAVDRNIDYKLNRQIIRIGREIVKGMEEGNG